jgi:hypothetical protein
MNDLRHLSPRLPRAVFVALLCSLLPTAFAQIGLGAKAPADAEVLIDGSRTLLDDKWTYWTGPRFASAMPIKWKIVDDPVDRGTVLQTDDPAAAGGKYGGNSGVYLQNRYEIQICDSDATKHGMGAVINETPSPYFAYKGIGQWNSYDIQFRAARFKDGKRTEPAMVTLYFNGIKVHSSQTINQVWGGANSGLDGGNDGGKGITDVPGGLKLQCEGHDVRYRNAWIKELDLVRPNTDFKN